MEQTEVVMKARKVLASLGVVGAMAMATFSCTTTTYAMDASTATTYAKTYVYSNTDISKPSGISKEDFLDYCSNMKYDRGYFKAYASDIYDACQTYGFNEFAFIGIVVGEGGWKSADCNPNQFGTLGVSYSSTRGAIYEYVKKMHTDYLTVGGKYCQKAPQTGTYELSLRAVGPVYCPHSYQNSNEKDWHNWIIECIWTSAYRSN